MRILIGMLLAGGLLAAASLSEAQGPGPGGGREVSPTKEADAQDVAARMMAYDADKDGKLARAEVTDDRLLRLFDRADANKDGSVTKEELVALGAKEHAEDRGGFGGPGGPGGPGGFGPPGGMPRPGDVLPSMLRQRLGLSSEQKAQVDALQKDVDDRLAKILNDDQKAQLKQMRDRGPGGPGGFGPPGGGRPGGPGGRPGPGGDGPPPDRPF